VVDGITNALTVTLSPPRIRIMIAIDITIHVIIEVV
jgi:hypothetical protein